MKILYSISRAWHWLRAFVGGYFWLPCPVWVAGEHEGGDGALMRGDGSGEGVCNACSAKAHEINLKNKAYLWQNPQPPPAPCKPSMAGLGMAPGSKPTLWIDYDLWERLGKPDKPDSIPAYECAARRAQTFASARECPHCGGKL